MKSRTLVLRRSARLAGKSEYFPLNYFAALPWIVDRSEEPSAIGSPSPRHRKDKFRFETRTEHRLTHKELGAQRSEQNQINTERENDVFDFPVELNYRVESITFSRSHERRPVGTFFSSRLLVSFSPEWIWTLCIIHFKLCDFPLCRFFVRRLVSVRRAFAVCVHHRRRIFYGPPA